MYLNCKPITQLYAGKMVAAITDLLHAKSEYADILNANGVKAAAAEAEAERVYEAAWKFMEDQNKEDSLG